MDARPSPDNRLTPPSGTAPGAPQPAARDRAIGYLLLLGTSVGWGLNWPATKRLLTELPPLTGRGVTGIVGAMLLALIAVAAGQSLRVPRAQRARLVLYAILNVSSWMALMGLALIYLPAGEAAVLAYTMPVWAAVLARPILGERISLLRVVAMGMALAGLVALMGGSGIGGAREKLPGIAFAMVGAFAFALGTVLAKRWPLTLPPLTSAVWQIGIGCLPVTALGFLIETSDFVHLSSLAWVLLVYAVVVQFCVAYVCWFAALQRLPASVAAIGTMMVPVIGVLASAAALGEPLGPSKIAALLFTVGGVALATRS